MAIIDIPTGVLPEEVVDSLPAEGVENKVYRRLVEDEELREMQITDDFIWANGEWVPFSFDAKICGAYFSMYQNSVSETVTEMEQTIEAQAQTITALEQQMADVEAGIKKAKIKLTVSSSPSALTWCLWDVNAGKEIQHNVFSTTKSSSAKSYEVPLTVKAGVYKFFNDNYIITQGGSELQMDITDFGDYEVGTVSIEAKGGVK